MKNKAGLASQPEHTCQLAEAARGWRRLPEAGGRPELDLANWPKLLGGWFPHGSLPLGGSPCSGCTAHSSWHSSSSDRVVGATAPPGTTPLKGAVCFWVHSSLCLACANFSKGPRKGAGASCGWSCVARQSTQSCRSTSRWNILTISLARVSLASTTKPSRTRQVRHCDHVQPTLRRVMATAPAGPCAFCQTSCTSEVVCFLS